ncbi:MAG: RIP metalloprotease RseP [Lewinellaceae bacterium]|nr:RIP metalloprotease RseP [Saprospiraceae bacterium]MCB9311842.1 RIP metalloprotease RseP [Lewinellaceae bacterium]
MEIAIKILQLITSLSLLIVLHELGHFLPARWFRTRVEKFYLFFDPYFSLIKKKIGETEYGIGWIPLGGYVKISGMIDESMDKEQMAGPPQPWEFRSKPAWQRLIIMLGGVTVNFILGFFIFGMMLFAWGREYLPAENVKYGIAVDSLGRSLGLEDGDRILKIGDLPFNEFSDRTVVKEILIHNAPSITVEREGREVSLAVPEGSAAQLASSSNKGKALFSVRIPFIADTVVVGSPAAEGGMLADDQIISVDGIPTPFYHNFKQVIADKADQDVQIGVLRGMDTVLLDIRTNAQAMIGVGPYYYDHFFQFETQEYSLFQALPAGVVKGWDFLASQIKAFGQMFRGKINASDSLGGFITIYDMFPAVWDWHDFWNMTAILSLILAFMNLLPIPALDGGHVIFLLWEVVTRRKVSDKVMEYATLAGFILVIGLVLYANGLDLFRLFNK